MRRGKQYLILAHTVGLGMFPANCCYTLVTLGHSRMLHTQKELTQLCSFWPQILDSNEGNLPLMATRVSRPCL